MKTEIRNDKCQSKERERGSSRAVTERLFSKRRIICGLFVSLRLFLVFYKACQRFWSMVFADCIRIYQDRRVAGQLLKRATSLFLGVVTVFRSQKWAEKRRNSVYDAL